MQDTTSKTFLLTIGLRGLFVLAGPFFGCGGAIFGLLQGPLIVGFFD